MTLPANPYVHVEAAGRPTTLLIFSSRNAPGFDYQGAAGRLDCNRIILRDPAGDSWYNTGVEGLGGDVEAIRAGLSSIIAELGGERLFVLGSSMGGYGAILFGSLLGAERVLAFSPQTLLDPILPIAPPREVRLDVPDLRPIMEAHPRPRIQIVGSDLDLADLFHMARVGDLPNVELFNVLQSEHWVALQLHWARKMMPLLQSWFEHGTIPEHRKGVWLDDSDFLTAVLEGTPAFYEKDYNRTLEVFAPAALLFPDHAGLQFWLGVVLWHLRAYPAAERAFRRALAVRPAWADANHWLGLAIVLQDRAAEAEPLFRASIALTSAPWAEAHFWIGYCLDRLGYPDSAAVEMWRSHEIKPDLIDPIRWLEQKGLPLEAPSA